MDQGYCNICMMVTTTTKVELLANGILMRYMGLALLNELAFTTYK
jgi:hypothetical protein